MSKVVLIPNGEKIYAVPTEIITQYALEGKALESAKEVLESDVEGQSGLMWNSRNEAYEHDGDYNWRRAPQYD